MTQTELAATFHALHDDLLVLPNCWDAASATVIEHAGAQALATSSAAVAWSLGTQDGNVLDRELMLAHLRRICAVATVPVSCDIEGGFGDSTADLAETTRLVIEAGAVGVNIEDAFAGALRPIDEAADRVRVVREAAADAGIDLYINGRTDSYLLGAADFDDTIARATAYLDAGASGIFVPGVTDLEVVSRLTAAIDAPVNILTGPSAPAIPRLKEAGARRVSAGSSLAGAIFGHLERAARELLDAGTYDELAGARSHGELNALFG
ncbi:MAG TPA: isocitrate lyase/phosphoenolpyruvate mutase family protein [Flexivirga sp.]|uniref:isocitrate lyase/PEP mutase family protein n=1 Tax=Flexivirga sp. TaxID=1962927 RepID=UPI002C80E3B6|nr:isocitrate lyase/phosphoenolpyruvate mutase family protein [Flexivirga sp.]HWC23695.1 isocitrate lyase/phosphoenolpyruvate mutase family protein [Flexivirga sp.]